MSRDELERAYRNTAYCVDGPQGPVRIRIDENSATLDALLAEYGVGSWVFITAWNPRSEEISIENNRLLNNSLRAELLGAGYRWLEGSGVADDRRWSEESLLVFGLPLEVALALGRRYGQNAIVAGTAGGCAVLHWCDESDADTMSG